MNKEENKPCMTCLNKVSPQQKDAAKCQIAENNTIFASVNYRPSTKAHTVIYTKRHCEDIRQMTTQEWADILPILKESIAKIDRTYHPLGYRISMPNGKNAGQDYPFHSYTRLVPKYKKHYSNTGVPASEKVPLSPEFNERKKKLQMALQPNQDKIIAQTDRLVIKLLNEEEIIPFSKETLTGSIAISTKAHLPNDINAIDQETWNEIGGEIKKLVKKIETETGCSGFSITTTMGQKAVKIWKEEAELPANHPYPDSEFIINLIPVYEKKPLWIKENRKINKPPKIISIFENERIASKLNDPKAYAQEWGKKLPRQEEETNSPTKTNLQNQETKAKASIWKQPTLYWGLGGGAVITALLGLGLFLFWKKNQKK